MGEAEELFAEEMWNNPTYRISLYTIEEELDGEREMRAEVSIIGHHLDDMPGEYEDGYVQTVSLLESGEGSESDRFRPCKDQIIDDAKRLIEHVEWGEYTTTSEGGYEVEVNLGPATWNAKLPTETLTHDHPVSELLDRYYGSQK